MSDFDAYHKWLGIPAAEQPPNHYRLLGISLFEKDRDVVIVALDQRQRFLTQKANGPHGELAGPLLEQLQQARLCLLNRLTKAQYDSKLRERGVTAASTDPGGRGDISLPVSPIENQHSTQSDQNAVAAPINSDPALLASTNSDATPPVKPDDGESGDGFPMFTETAFHGGLASSKRMEQRSLRLAWAINLVVLCCVSGGGWWLMELGILPPLETLLQVVIYQQQAERSHRPETDEEFVTNRQPAAVPKPQQSGERNSMTKSVAAERRTSKRPEPAIDLARFAHHQTAIVDFSLSADGRLLATAGPEGDCRVWDVTTGETTARFTGHSGHIHAIALSPDGTQVLSSSETLKLWSAATGNELAELITNRRPSRAILFLSDRQRVATVGTGAIEIWNLHTRQPVHMFSGVHSFCGTIAMTADSQTLAGATGAQAEEATLFDVALGKATRTFAGHRARLSSMVMSKDGMTLWTAAGDHNARRWDIKTGTTDAIFAHANVLALSPDESLLATGGLSGFVTIWNARTGSGLLQLPRQTLRVMDIAFLPDGQHLLFAGDSTDPNDRTATIQLWELPMIDPNGSGSRPNPVLTAGSVTNEVTVNSLPTDSTESDSARQKLPLPTLDQREQVKKLVREIFKHDFAKAVRSSEKAKLSETLLEHAKAAINDPAKRYVLLQEANELASSSGDLDVATKVIDELTTSFDVDALDVRSTTLRKLTTTVKSGPPQERLAGTLLQLAEECATVSRYDAAIEATKAAALLAIKAKNLKLRDTAKNRTDEYLLKSTRP